MIIDFPIIFDVRVLTHHNIRNLLIADLFFNDTIHRENLARRIPDPSFS